MSPMTFPQQAATILLCILATTGTRFLPFLFFSSRKPTPAFVQYLGKALPSAIFAILVVYCLRNVDFAAAFALPEALAILAIVLLHLWKRQMLLSIAGGTVVYMLLVQLVF